MSTPPVDGGRLPPVKSPGGETEIESGRKHIGKANDCLQRALDAMAREPFNYPDRQYAVSQLREAGHAIFLATNNLYGIPNLPDDDDDDDEVDTPIVQECDASSGCKPRVVTPIPPAQEYPSHSDDTEENFGKGGEA